jgi:GTP cyclohydrolase I
MPFEPDGLPYRDSVTGRNVIDLEAAAPETLMYLLLNKVMPDFDWDGEDVRETPRRFVKMMKELTDASEHWKFTVFKSDAHEMVIVKQIRFVSMCSHHLAPYTGVCHVGYIPDGVIAGLSKIARQIQTIARTPSVQEELTTAIADTFDDILTPSGVIIVMRAHHSCMSLRGALAHEAETITSAVRGVFYTNERGTKDEFLRLIGLT